jgi:hypothetical protein
MILEILVGLLFPWTMWRSYYGFALIMDEILNVREEFRQKPSPPWFMVIDVIDVIVLILFLYKL